MPKRLQNKEIVSFSILFIFLFTTFSGSIRKWVTNNTLISNLLLLIQLLAPFIFVKLLPKSKSLPFLSIWLTCYAGLLIIQACNPYNHTLFHGMLGFILHFGFWWALYSYFQRRTALVISQKLLRILLYTSIGVVGLAIIQYQLPSSHVLNKYVGNEAIAKVGTAVRVTSTFSYLSGYTSFLMFLGFLGWTLSVRKVNVKWTYLVVLMLPIATILSGSRAALVVSLFLISITLLEITTSKGILPILVVGSFLILMFTIDISAIHTFIELAVGNFSSRINEHASSGEQTSRIITPLLEIMNFRGDHPFFGLGLGGTYQGAIALFGESFLLQEYPGGYEEEPERIILEGGYLLFFFKLLLFAVAYKHLFIPKTYLIPLFILIILYTPIVFNTYNSAYILLGLILVDSAYRQNNV